MVIIGVIEKEFLKQGGVPKTAELKELGLSRQIKNFGR